jgi:hypothetical protein
MYNSHRLVSRSFPVSMKIYPSFFGSKITNLLNACWHFPYFFSPKTGVKYRNLFDCNAIIFWPRKRRFLEGFRNKKTCFWAVWATCRPCLVGSKKLVVAMYSTSTFMGFPFTGFCLCLLWKWGLKTSQKYRLFRNFGRGALTFRFSYHLPLKFPLPFLFKFINVENYYI